MEIIYRNDPNMAEREKEYNQKLVNPYPAAELGFLDSVIVPEETRRIIASDLEMLQNKKLTNPWKKHGNIPL